MANPLGNITTPQFVAGSRLYLEYAVYNETTDPPVLIDPVTIVITLKNPLGAVIVAPTTMTRVRKGIYSFIYQSQPNDVAGYWSGTVTTSDLSGTVGISLPNDQLFLLIAP